MNEYVASLRVVDAHPQGPVQPGAKFRRTAVRGIPLRRARSLVDRRPRRAHFERGILDRHGTCPQHPTEPMTDAVKVLASSPFDRRLLRKARKSEVDAWDFTDMQWSALEQVARLDPWGRDENRSVHLAERGQR